ncbi:hypothetical protein MADA3029_420139 [Vibrio nigripulchritudo MADA3029]|uniref:hypothetical protein n=1 Tax=Vibrio nigripulchritudo TaxID=28173 RepID=UPI0003B1DB36|nr:hypothetical protein [Vibrio nigripulchritudo]CCN46672.1 hypothetical protein VIBNIMADA3020_160139 [Vibrio nigripulchritudo MADA3020]CCN54551.1 hypothetical protein VIBNIMADA3021_560038 [Vibrio nigripulchritudo MADA3021]CCN59531.1 hypothetical protein MADA3029_420139 [Vibrio nigripulchritudo MADA3029]
MLIETTRRFATKRKTTLTGIAIASALAVFPAAANQLPPFPDHLNPIHFQTKIMLGDLRAYLKGIDYGSKGDNAWEQPSAQDLATFKSAFQALMDGNTSAASNLVSPLDYDVIEYHDSVTGKLFYVLQEKYPLSDSRSNGGGTYVYDPSGVSAVLQAPHPRHDLFTATQSIDDFFYTSSKYLMLAGTHRNSNTTLSQCTNGNYKESDVAHQTSSYFQSVHESIDEFATPNTVFIQYHGFGSTTLKKLQKQCGTTSSKMLNISEGVRYATSDNSSSFMHALRRQVESENLIEACIYGNDTTSLGGTWNVQGRFTNHSSNACHTNASSSQKRFVHLEQSYSVRKYNRDDMSRYLKNAMDEYFTTHCDNCM